MRNKKNEIKYFNMKKNRLVVRWWFPVRKQD